jgi:CBS domain-containing protein
VLVKRLAELGQVQLGAPPANFAWIVFGSEGRLEQALLTDQDNALVYDDSSEDISRYFTELSRLVVEGLIQAGFPRCPGGFMATNWCKPLHEWRRLFTNWIALPEPVALLDAAIFFDFRVVAGALSLESLEQIIAGAQSEKLFHSHMLNGALAFRPPLGFFNWLRSANGDVDLKKGGIGPIVGLARAAALAAGSRERSTLERLRVAGASGAVLSPESAKEFAEIFPLLLGLRLRAQLAARKRGRPLSNSVNLAELSTLEKRHLKEALIIIKDAQEDLRAAWRLDRLG